MVHATEGQGSAGNGFAMFTSVNFCAHGFSDFGITTLLKHHPKEKFCKGMLARLRWGPRRTQFEL